METELKAIHDSRKSFYGKAKVRVENMMFYTKKVILKSYDTDVAYITIVKDGVNRAFVLDTHSQTTLRHIKEFLKQNGFKAESKAQIITDYWRVKA